MKCLRYILSFMFGLVACGTIDTLPLDKPIDGEICKAACDNRLRLNCLETKLLDVCIPVCHKTASAGLYDPNCAARAQTKFDMAKCNIRCWL